MQKNVYEQKIGCLCREKRNIPNNLKQCDPAL